MLPTASKSCLAALLLSSTLFAFAPGATAADATYRVDLNKTQILRLPASAGSVIIGNPDIADVTVQSPRTLFVVGKGFGETNLIVLDQAGQTMVNADVQVTAITPKHGVRVFNAKQRESYSCAPFCQPSPVLGDEPGFIGENSNQDGAAPVQGPVFGQDFGDPTLEGSPGGFTQGSESFSSGEDF